VILNKSVQQKILLFIPGGKGIYGSALLKELQSRGLVTYVYDERPSKSFVSKSVIRFLKPVSILFTKRYFRKIIKTHTQSPPDLILVIRGEAFSPAIMADFRKNFPKAYLILYLWDSIRYTDTRKIHLCFDKVLSFDSEDVRRYRYLKFRPLFFINSYNRFSNSNNREFDIVFIGKIHSDRYQFLKAIKVKAIEENLRVYYYMYLPSRIHFYIKKIFTSTLKKAKISEFHFRMMPANEVADYISKTNACVDTQHPYQSGLTMRTIETLGAKRKLITTNGYIREYDFYNPNNISIIDLKNPILDIHMLKTQYLNIDDNIYKNYTLERWLDDVLKKE